MKAEIDQKLKTNGAPSYTLVVTELPVSARATLVGTCENGSKKIYYLQGAVGVGPVISADLPGTKANAPVKPKDAETLTECKAGFGGPDCKIREKTP